MNWTDYNMVVNINFTKPLDISRGIVYDGITLEIVNT